MTNAKSFKILGQEPAAVLGVVRAVLTMLVTFGFSSYLTTETSGVILAAASAALGLVEAYVTRTTLYSAALGFGQAVVILAVTFGLNLDDVKQAALLSTLAVVLGFFLRDRTTSTETALTNASPGDVVQADQAVITGDNAVVLTSGAPRFGDVSAAPAIVTDVDPALLAAAEQIHADDAANKGFDPLEGLNPEIRAEIMKQRAAELAPVEEPAVVEDEPQDVVEDEPASP